MPERAAYHKVWYVANRERLARLTQAWAAANRDRRNDSWNRRRALKAGPASSEPVSRALVFERDEGICGICLAPVDPVTWHLDHIVPLSRGGPHNYANVQVAHPLCNLSKGRKVA